MCFVGEVSGLPPDYQNKIDKKALIGLSKVNPRDTNTPRIKPDPAVISTKVDSAGSVAIMFVMVFVFNG